MALISGSSPLAADLNDIIKKPPGYSSGFLFSTILHTEEKDLNESEGVMIAALREEEDYIQHTTTYVQITLMVKLGTYVYDIFPFAHDLELSLSKVRQNRFGNGLDATEFTVRYKAVYLPQENSKIPTNIALPRETLDKQGYITIDLQLVDIGTLALRNDYSQGHYSNLISEANQNMNYDSLMKSILNTAINDIEIDSKKPVDKINIEEPDNESPIEAVTIPTGTLTLDVPLYFQEKLGGVYTGGIGTFIKYYATNQEGDPEKTLFVYSLYNQHKFREEDNKIMFFASPDQNWNITDVTYTYKGNLLKIMTFPTNGPMSNKEVILRNEGEGFRTGAAGSIIDNPLEFTDEGPKFRKTNFLTELTNKPNEDGINNIPYMGISNNHFINSTEILSRSGEYIVLRADHVDSNYYTPGAGVMLIYQPGPNIVNECYGNLHKVTTIYEYVNLSLNEEINKLRHYLTATSFFTIFLTDVI